MGKGRTEGVPILMGLQVFLDTVNFYSMDPQYLGSDPVSPRKMTQ